MRSQPRRNFPNVTHHGLYILLIVSLGAQLSGCGGSNAPKPVEIDGTGGAGSSAGSPTSNTSDTTTDSSTTTTSTTGTTTSSTTAATNTSSSSTTAAGGNASTTTDAGATNTTGPTMASGCESPVTVNPNPFGCEFAWGANGNQGGRSNYLNFITTWVGYEQNGGLNGQCDGCGLVSDLANSDAIAVYYAYLIGYMTSEDGYGDCNTDFDGQNLCTHGAQWIRENRDRLIDAYANYAQMTYETNPNKPVAWLLEGDFVQYTYEEQTQGLSIAELGELATDIVCAIKSNAPNALVSINHSPWISDELTDDFWNAMPVDLLDFIWTTGVGNNGGYINGDATAGTYNATSANYQYLNQLTGKGILVDTSFGASQADDSWSGVDASTLNERIGEGVIAANVTEPPNDYQSRVEGMSLNSTCQ